MFGYITINRPELKIKDEQTYRAFYCGLCRALKKRHGLAGQSTLSYDMTFVALLLSALYEPPTEEGTSLCVVHPLEKHPTVSNELLDYAADMNLLLACYNLRDDWQDEKKLRAKIGADLMQRHVRQIEAAWPRQAQAVRDYLAKIAEIEKKGEPDLDGPAGATGEMLGEILVKEEDVWSPHLRQMGFYLGKFIYLMDAFEDIEKDLKKGNYNPWSGSGKSRLEIADRAQEVLTMMLSETCLAFERLPILRYEEILRNILYAGVWTQFDAIALKDKEEAMKKTQPASDAQEGENKE